MSSLQQYFDPDFESSSELINDIRKLFRRNKCIGDIYLMCTNGRRIPLWLIRDLIGIPKTLEDVFWIRPLQ